MARKYRRDARGRFAGGGYSGQSGGRGARLKAGGTRQGGGAKMSAARIGGTVAKPRGLKPESPRKLKTGLAIGRMREVNRRLANKQDIAQQHIPGRFKGQAGKRLEASIDRAVRDVAAYQRARFMKPKEQVRAEAAARKAAKEAAAAAKPKRTRTPLSLRTSRAKRIVKEREMKTSGTLRQWENSRRTQERALAVYAQQSRRR